MVFLKASQFNSVFLANELGIPQIMNQNETHFFPGNFNQSARGDRNKRLVKK